jgi:hypothetical protein
VGSQRHPQKPDEESIMTETLSGVERQLATPADVDVETAFEQIRQALRGLRYGNVTVTVQDGVVVQIDRTERRRPVRGNR